MSIIKKIADDIYLTYIQRGPKPHDQVLSKVREKNSDIDDKLDKITILQYLLDKTNEDYANHLPLCSDRERCRRNKEYEAIVYYLHQELKRLGVKFDNDTFTYDEVLLAEEKINLVLQEIMRLEIGQTVIYEDIQKELLELKELYFLGKKRWYQIFVGKLTEMSLSGVVSETISKNLIQVVKTGIKLLGF